MKKTVKRLQQTAALLCMAAFLFTLFGTAAVKAAGTEECLAEMAQETADYMRSRGLQITNSAYSFANNNGEKVYSLTSADSVKAGSSLNRTQSVIHYKNSEGQSDFYVINLDVQPERMTYTISRNSQLFDKIDISLAIPGGPGNPCAGALTQAQVDTILNNLLAQANADCRNRYTCLFQMMGSSCAYVAYVIKPTSWRCRILTPVDVQLAVDRAIANTAVFAP
ncbi:MAG TPA: hypothetical protein VF604_17250 [Pyrinomonadaceae bacterium]|jgi:hypothetical protein